MTLAEFYDETEDHDWFYAMSDDGRKYREGRADYSRLCMLAKSLGSEAVELFSQLQAHYSGQVIGVERPKPERPSC